MRLHRLCALAAVLLVLCGVSTVGAADRYFVNGGVDNNWSTVGNWSLTSGGAGGQTVPSASDAVFLDANSPNCIVNTTTRTALSLNATGYTNTLTFNAGLNVSGSITLSSSMTLAGASTLAMIATGTLTSNGKVLNVPFTIGNANVTVTLADTATATGLVTINGSSGQTIVINGSTFVISGSFSITNRIFISGTTNFKMNGTGTLTRNNAESNFNNNLEIDTGGIVTFAGMPGRTAGTFTLTNGTMAGSFLETVSSGANTDQWRGPTWR